MGPRYPVHPSDGHDLEVDQVDFQGLGRKSTTSRRLGVVIALRAVRSRSARGQRSIYSVLSTNIYLHSSLLAPSPRITTSNIFTLVHQVAHILVDVLLEARILPVVPRAVVL
jgi:hypothetical protein